MEIVPVVLSGGSGTRLWPLSRNTYPKQFINLVGDLSLFQETAQRARKVCSGRFITVCNENHRFLVAEQLRQVGEEHARILLEPKGRNTAPAVALAAIQALRDSDGEAPMILVMPSDHLIRDTSAFASAVEAGIDAAREGKLVTFGIVPDKAETGYGYIRALAETGYVVNQVFPVDEFVEKPDAETAQRYVDSQEYLWNSGMFLFRADVYLEALGKYQPQMRDCCEKAMAACVGDNDFLRPERAVFEECPADSIDYAVMEPTDDAVVIPMDAGWNDVGAWSSLWEVQQQDEDGNAVRGDVLTHDSRNCLIHAEHRLVATLGLDGVVVVETPDAVLVADKNQVQDVKKLVESLNGRARNEAIEHRKVYRPWGHYDSIDMGERFQVKRITVNPGEVLSLQKHFHRAEHWVVVSGTAEITRDDEVFILTENQSAYIPLGAVHRLVNPGSIPLELIEVQSGSYLGEDDIVRLSDNYGREGET